MATSVRNATLKVTIEEEINLNGVRQGAKNVKRISDINEIYRRIVSCPANNETTVALFHGTVYSDDSTLDVEDVKYIRVTNLDDTNSLTLNLQVDAGEDDTAADESASILVGAGESFVMGTPSDGIAVQDTNANIETSLHNLESIIIYPGSNVVDVEVFVASA